MDNINIYRKILILILLPALCWLFFNSIYYRHLHELPTGITISHAHPYDKSDDCLNTPFTSHTHTEDEFVFYDIISNIILLIIISGLVLILFLEKLRDDIKIVQGKIIKLNYYLLQKYRGPPCNL